MQALVIGASGQVGAALALRLRERGHTVVGTHSGVARDWTVPLDVRDAAAVARLVEEAAPDWVFCPAGLTHVDYCEDHAEEAFAVNRDAAAGAAGVATKRGAGFVYFSTEYVFDGTAGPYAEDDPPQPLSVYGASKLAGEVAVREANARSIVVRTTVVYGPEPQGKNFVYQLVRRLAAGERMPAPIDQRSSPTYNVDLAAATVELAEAGHAGIHHVAGSEILDRYALARAACRVYDLDPALLDPVVTAALRQRAARPLRAGLRIDRVRTLVRTQLRAPAAGLVAMRAVLASGTGDVARLPLPA